MQAAEARKPGRPRRAVGSNPNKAEEVLLPRTEKKGTLPQWKPGGRLAKLNVSDGYKGRWCSKDSVNIQQKLEEGWRLVNKTTAPTARQEGNDAPDLAYDGKALDSAVQYRDMVGMMLPINDGTGQCVEARQQWIQNENEKLLRSRVQLGADRNAESAQLSKLMISKKPTLTIE